MLSFLLSIFPVTGITGAGQFVHDGGLFSWVGWTQLALLIAQVACLAMLRQSIVQHTALITAEDVLTDPDTQVLIVFSFLFLVLGIGFYIYGIWRTRPISAPTKKK